FSSVLFVAFGTPFLFKHTPPLRSITAIQEIALRKQKSDEVGHLSGIQFRRRTGAAPHLRRMIPHGGDITCYRQRPRPCEQVHLGFVCLTEGVTGFAGAFKYCSSQLWFTDVERSNLRLTFRKLAKKQQ